MIVKKIIYIISFAGLMLAALAAWGQTDPLGGKDTLTLENERIEDVIESNKPSLNPPKPKPPTLTTEGIRYESKDFQIETDYEPAPPDPKPLELEPENAYLYNNFVKAGIGRFTTPLLQLYLNNGEDPNVDYGLEFTHHSAHNDKVEFRQFRRDHGKISGSLQNESFKLYGLFGLYNTEYFNYGDTLNINDGNSDTTRMVYTRVNFDAGLKSLEDPRLPYYYDLGLGLKNYDGLRGNREFHFSLLPKGGFFITQELSLDAVSEFTFISSRIGGAGQNRTFMGFAPQIVYESAGFQARAGFAWNRFKKNVDSTAFSQLGPKIEASFALFPEELSIIAGVTSGMTNNHYYDMIHTNPYLTDSVDIRPTLEKINVYGGLKGNVGQRLDYTAKVYYQRVENPLVYFVPEEGAYFEALYDSLMTVFGVFAEVNHDLTSDIRAGASLNLNRYNTSTLERNFHAPPLRLDVYGSYTWEEKLTVRARANFYSQTPVSLFENGDVLSRGTFVNVSATGDYRVTERFSVYVALENLLSGTYERWHNYPERPIDISGGLTFIF